MVPSISNNKPSKCTVSGLAVNDGSSGEVSGDMLAVEDVSV